MYYIIFESILFADVSTITCNFSIMTVENITSSFNKNSETGNQLLTVNKNKVNTHKSYILFSYTNKLLLPLIRLAKLKLKKKLGITLDVNLYSKQYINEMCNKPSRSVGNLYKLNLEECVTYVRSSVY